MSLHTQWVTAIIRCSSRIFTYKQRFISARGLALLSLALALVVCEISLWLLSLPFIIISPTRSPELTASGIRMRRLVLILVLLILTGVWLVKGVGHVVHTVLVERHEHFSAHLSLATTTVMDAPGSDAARPQKLTLLPPRILSVKRSGRTLVAIQGDGAPRNEIVVFIDDQAKHRSLRLVTATNEQGSWSLGLPEFGMRPLQLPTGVYALTAFARVPSVQLQSVPSSPYVVHVQEMIFVRAIQALVPIGALAAVIIGFFALLITFLTIA